MSFKYPSIKYMVLAALCLNAAACKKQSDTVCGVPLDPSGHGIVAYKQKNITLWVNKDYQKGKLTLTSFINTRTNTNESYTGNDALTAYYASGTPQCGATGCATLNVRAGFEYQYTFSAADNSHLSGTISLDCADTCQKFLVQ